jgi:hypothetical protein
MDKEEAYYLFSPSVQGDHMTTPNCSNPEEQVLLQKYYFQSITVVCSVFTTAS